MFPCNLDNGIFRTYIHLDLLLQIVITFVTNTFAKGRVRDHMK